MIFVISDFRGVVAVVKLPKGSKIKKLRSEYEKALGRKPNPYAYNTPVQYEWLKDTSDKEANFVLKYGGEGDKVFGAGTFAGWLVAEKGAKLVSYREYCMAEFD